MRSMSNAGSRGTLNHLTKEEAGRLATELMEALQQIMFSPQPASLEDVATAAARGLRFLEDSQPTATENTPPFLKSLPVSVAHTMSNGPTGIISSPAERRGLLGRPDRPSELHAPAEALFHGLPGPLLVTGETIQRGLTKP